MKDVEFGTFMEQDSWHEKELNAGGWLRQTTHRTISDYYDDDLFKKSRLLLELFSRLIIKQRNINIYVSKCVWKTSRHTVEEIVFRDL